MSPTVLGGNHSQRRKTSDAVLGLAATCKFILFSLREGIEKRKTRKGSVESKKLKCGKEVESSHEKGEEGHAFEK